MIVVFVDVESYFLNDGESCFLNDFEIGCVIVGHEMDGYRVPMDFEF